MDTNSLEGKLEAMHAKLDELEQEAHRTGRIDLFKSLRSEWEEKAGEVRRKLEQLNDPGAGRPLSLASDLENAFEDLRDRLRKTETQLA